MSPKGAKLSPSITTDTMKDNLPIEADQEAELIRNLGLYSTVKEAGKQAGYSESFCQSAIYTKMKRPKFLDKVRDYYKSNNTTLLPKILKAETDLLNIILKEPEKLSKHNNTIKQIKQAAGILEHDDQPKQQTINIKAAQMVMQQIINPEPTAIEGEVID